MFARFAPVAAALAAGLGVSFRLSIRHFVFVR